MIGLEEKYADLIETFSRNFAVPPKLPPEIWASRHVVLASDISDRYDPSSSPYFVQPFRAMCDSAIREVYLCASPGMGKTALLEALTCYLVVNSPGDILIASKNLNLLGNWLDTRLNPILARCEPLADYMPKSSDRQKSLLLLKHCWVQARAANFASFQGASCRYQIGDEAWQWGSEGLIEYLRKRGHDRFNRKLILVSQAGVVGSDWEQTTNEADRFEYFWQCTACGVKRAFDFDTNLKWDTKDVVGSTRLVCPCGKEYLDTPENRRSLSSNGSWELVQKGEEPTRQCYTISSVANFRVAWSELVKEFLKARKAWGLGYRDPYQLFVMQRCSKMWKDEYEREESVLKISNYSLSAYAKAEKIDGEIVRFMTIDRQKDGNSFWVVIRAWRDGGSSRLLHFGYVMREEDLRAMQVAYAVEDRFTFQDSAYDSTNTYAMCSKYGWWAVAGTGEAGFQHAKKDARGRPNGFEIRLYSPIQIIAVGATKCRCIRLASDKLKDIMTHLRDGKSSIAWEIPSDVPELYRQQISNEVKRETVDVNKRAVFKWTQIGANHSFDLEYHQVAAALISGVLRLD